MKSAKNIHTSPKAETTHSSSTPPTPVDADLLLEEEDGEELEDDAAELLFDDDMEEEDSTHPLLPESDLSEKPLPVPVDKRGTQNSLNLYMREISKFPLLTPEEEYSLARKVIDENDPDAAFRLVSSHLRLVVKIAMDFQRRWMQNVLDLVQEGNVSLMRAVHKFDPEKGIKFSYYAAFWIKAYILKFIMDNWRMVKIGTTQAQRKLFYNLNKERQKLIAQGFDPDSATLSKHLNVSEKQVIEMEQRMDGGDVSLDATINTDGQPGASRIELLPALGPGIEDMLGDSQVASLVREKLTSIVPLLSEKEAYILEYRLLNDEPVTLREIGEKYDITRERVRQIEARLLQKVRDHLFKEIKDFSQDWITNE
jgi:RNA polymerase sigma-32 factor